jgi:hypothetical protein
MRKSGDTCRAAKAGTLRKTEREEKEKSHRRQEKGAETGAAFLLTVVQFLVDGGSVAGADGTQSRNSANRENGHEERRCHGRFHAQAAFIRSP